MAAENDGRPAWARGMRRLGPGVYTDGRGSVHVDPPGILASLGLDHTAHSERILAEVVAALCGREGMEFVEVMTPDGN